MGITSRFFVCAFVLGIAGCGGSPPPTLITDTGPIPDHDAGMDAMIAPHDAWTPPPVDAGPTCMGMAPACEAFDNATQCNAVMGCGYGACTGSPPDCHHLVDMTTCMAVAGCEWNGICRGTATACGTYTDMTSCMGQMNCTYGTMSTCSGASVPCTSLSIDECTSQPGCGLGPVDAWAPPPDVWVAPPDAGCMPGSTTSTTISVHTITPDLAAGGITDLAGVHVLAESACGGASMELVTDASGNLTADLADSGAPWNLTFAKVGYAAISIVDGGRIGPIGDVRLDPLMIGTTMTSYVAAGTITGAAGSGSHFQVDCPDFETITTPVGTRTWSSQFQVGNEQPEPPIQFVALELDASGNALNIGSTAAMSRPTAAISGVSIAMASPVVAPTITHVSIHLPSTGLTSSPSATVLGAEHADFDLPNMPYTFSGSAQVTPVGGDPTNLDLAIRHFSGPLDVNMVPVQAIGAVALVNVVVTDITDHEITVGAVDDLTSHGSTLANLGATASGAGYDVLALQIGESTTTQPRWRVFADATSGQARILSVPHLPAGITLADIGLDQPSTTYIPLYIHMQTGSAWATQASNRSVWQYAWSVGSQYFPVSTSGR